MLRLKTSCWKTPRFLPIIRGTVLLSTALLLAIGCKVGPDYVGPPCPKIQNNWSEVTSEQKTGQDAIVHNELPALDDWWTVFNDPTMNLILKTVNEENLDIQIAAQRIYQAEMDYRRARGDLFPRIGAGASFNRTMFPGINSHQYSSSWDLDITTASWEIDVCGQIQRYIESYNAAWQATVEDRNNVKVLILAETARTYIQARLNQELERIAQEDIRDLETYLEKIRARHDAGADCNVELVQAQANLATVKATLPTIQARYLACTTRLASLMGATPERVDELLQQDVGLIPNAPDALAVGIPADIIRRRPDIRALERRIAQQTALVGVQQAELFPKFYVDGAFGLQSADLGDLFRSESLTTTIMPRVSWRVFEFGRIRATIAKQESITEEMRLEYQATVLEASEEVNNAITQYVKLQARYDEQLEAVRNYDEALKLSLALYEAGKREYMVVLDSQRFLLSNRQTLATVHAEAASAVVTLYAALGGGWQVAPQAASSLTAEYLRSDFVPNETLGSIIPGEEINQQGPLSGRNVPESIHKSSIKQSHPIALPPEGQANVSPRRNSRLTNARQYPEDPQPEPSIPAEQFLQEEESTQDNENKTNIDLDVIDGITDDVSKFPIPEQRKSILRSSPAREEKSEIDPLLAGLSAKK